MRERNFGLEKEIIWLEDISNIDYVREDEWLTTKPYCKPPRNDRERKIIGYSVLKSGLGDGYIYFRRLFTLRYYDRYNEPNGIYRFSCPAEAVDPKTIRPGIKGVRLNE